MDLAKDDFTDPNLIHSTRASPAVSLSDKNPYDTWSSPCEKAILTRIPQFVTRAVDLVAWRLRTGRNPYPPKSLRNRLSDDMKESVCFSA